MNCDQKNVVSIVTDLLYSSVTSCMQEGSAVKEEAAAEVAFEHES